MRSQVRKCARAADGARLRQGRRSLATSNYKRAYRAAIVPTSDFEFLTPLKAAHPFHNEKGGDRTS